MMNTAFQLMKQKGFRSTTIDEICEGAGVTKGCFFHYFEDKEQLGKELVERTEAQRGEAQTAGAFVKEKDPLKRLYAMIDSYMEQHVGDEQDGCILGTFAQELSETYPKIRAACEKSFSGWAEALAQTLDEVRALYMPRSSLDTRALAFYFISVLEGSLILAKAQKNAAVVNDNLKIFKGYLRSVFLK